MEFVKEKLKLHKLFLNILDVCWLFGLDSCQVAFVLCCVEVQLKVACNCLVLLRCFDLVI